MSTLTKIFAALLLAMMFSAAPGIANARGGHGGGGGHGGHGGGGHFHGGGGHFHGGHFRGGFGWGWGWPYYSGGYYDPYFYGDGCRWVRVRVWRGDHWRYRRIWRCWY